jgi:hypothetical protein
MKKSNRILSYLSSYFCLLLFIVNVQPVIGQQTSYEPKDPKLYKTIMHMDSVMFDAFNKHDLEVMKTVFATNLEFYHDMGGLADYTTSMNSFKSVFASTPGLRRELIPGTMEVYPIPGYGAVEMGMHRFIHVENGQTQVGLYKFIHTWQYKDNQWKVTRVVSVGH